MTLGRSLIDGLNRALAPVNLRLDTRTRSRAELARLRAVRASGHFERPVFPIPPAFEAMDPSRLLEAITSYRRRFEDFEDPSRNSTAYSFDNGYFTSPDAEVLYTVVREHRPRTVIEVGSGHSTRLIRQALADGGMSGRLVSIDPVPRRDLGQLADEHYLSPVESLRDQAAFAALRAGDILFVDSSHVVRTANDVVFLFLQVVPELRPGVLVHVHDIFLPYDYPADWIVERGWDWSEQYLIQALLTENRSYDVLWAGHYLQRTWPEFADHFPHARGRRASSLWLTRSRVS